MTGAAVTLALHEGFGLTRVNVLVAALAVCCWEMVGNRLPWSGTAVTGKARCRQMGAAKGKTRVLVLLEREQRGRERAGVMAAGTSANGRFELAGMDVFVARAAVLEALGFEAGTVAFATGDPGVFVQKRKTGAAVVEMCVVDALPALWIVTSAAVLAESIFVRVAMAALTLLEGALGLVGEEQRGSVVPFWVTGCTVEGLVTPFQGKLGARMVESRCRAEAIQAVAGGTIRAQSALVHIGMTIAAAVVSDGFEAQPSSKFLRMAGLAGQAGVRADEGERAAAVIEARGWLPGRHAVA